MSDVRTRPLRFPGANAARLLVDRQGYAFTRYPPTDEQADMADDVAQFLIS